MVQPQPSTTSERSADLRIGLFPTPHQRAESEFGAPHFLRTEELGLSL